jgi:WD40 repeat protein/class 3 adenylate cyclase/tRNA A-37 threonylcarbamoyl transferase component Bud32
VLTLFKERYEVLATLGSGGEAEIVKALDRQHDRLVALKIRPVRDEATREELLNEARVLLALPPHPALPLVREDFFDRDDYVVAMDWVDGTDLATLLADRGRPGLAPSSVLAYLAQAAEALAHLHAQSPPVIHGDVKPSNLILTTRGRIKLVDFGLSSSPTVPRRRAGTPGYRAPELAAGDAPSPASDVYALAATAFALLTGSAPAGVLPAWDGIDPAQAGQFEAAIRLGMATDPARRPKTPGELVERLRAGWSAALPTGVVTVCCSDIDRWAALWEAEPEATAEALVRHDELVVDAVEGRGGRVVQTMGEAGSTVSVFDSAPLAIEAALAAQRALAAESWPRGLSIAVRWGVHTGAVEQRGADYFGPAVAVGAWLRAQADGGQIFLSTIASELVSGHLPDGASLVDLGPHRVSDVGAQEHVFALEAPGVDAPPPATECPYRGLLAFDADDERFFFGRELVVAELVERMAPGRLVAVVGASGSGKSSVLHAGLVAAVRAGTVSGIEDAVVITPAADRAIEVPDSPARLLVVDQLEELFTVCDDAVARAAFVDALLGRRGPVAVGLRADLYGRVGAHPPLARAVAGSQVLLGAMTSAELERAVTRPARLAGLKLEPGLVELVVRDVGAEPGALPLLSHALRATWERRDGRTLTVAGYRASGGVSSAIARTASAVLDTLPDEQRSLARSVFLRLTELGEGTEDSRRRAAVAELVPEGVAPATVHALLERLADARLITLGDGSAEVAHEALIREWPQLRGWLEEDRAAIRAHRRLGDAARLWDAGGREPSDLLRGTRLAAAVELAQGDRTHLNANERAFIEAGVAESERERRAERRANRRLRALLASALVLLAVAVGAGVVSLAQRGKAQNAEATAERQALRSDAERVGALARSAPRLEQAMLLAVAGVQLEDRLNTRGDLLAVLQRNPAALGIHDISPSVITALAADPSGRLLATGDENGVVRFTDIDTWSPAGAEVRVPGAVGVQSMAYAPDGRTVAVGTHDGDRYELHLVDVTTRVARRVWTRGRLAPDAIVPTLLPAYAPGGRRLALAVATPAPAGGPPVGQRLVLLDARSGRTLWQRTWPMRPGQWEPHVRFLSGSRLVTSAQQGRTLVWNARTGEIARTFPVGGRPAVAPDGHTLALALNSANAGEPSATVGLLDVRTGALKKLSQELPEEWILGLAFTPDGRRIAGTAFNGAHVWDLASGSILETHGDRFGEPNPGLVVDGRGSLIVGAGAGAVSVWDLDGGQRLGRRFEWAPNTSSCLLNPCAVIDPRGKLMATPWGDGTVALVDLASGRLTARLPARNGPLADAVAFTAGGRRLVTGGFAGTVTIWDVQTRTVVRRLRFGGRVFSTVVSPDGRLLAVMWQREGDTGLQIEVRELPADRTRYVRSLDHGGGDLAFSADGSTVVALGCCRGGSVVVAWEADTGQRRFALRPPAQVTAFGLLPDSRGMLVGDADGGLALWDLRSGRPLGPTATVSGGGVSQITVAPDGRMFAIGTFDSEASLWDLDSLERVGEAFPIERGNIPAVAFDPHGRLLITELGSAILWPLDLAALQRFACRVAGRTLTPDEWRDVLPDRPYRHVCPSVEATPP